MEKVRGGLPRSVEVVIALAGLFISAPVLALSQQRLFLLRLAPLSSASSGWGSTGELLRSTNCALCGKGKKERRSQPAMIPA